MIRELFESEVEEISGGVLLVIAPRLPRTSGRTARGRRALRREIRDRQSLIRDARRGEIVFGSSGSVASLQRDIRRIRAAIRNRTRP